MTAKSFKLTDREKAGIRKDLAAGMAPAEVARKYGINKSTAQYYKNPASRKESFRKYHLKHRGKILASMREYHKTRVR